MDTASREAVGWETFILTYSFAMVLWTGDAPAAALVVTTARLSKPWCRLLQSQRFSESVAASLLGRGV